MSSPGGSRLIISGGRVLEPSGELDQPPRADILIENGRILAVGSEGSFPSNENAASIDASDRLVIPGFVNAHYHSHDVLLRGMFEQLPLEPWGLLSFPSSFPRRPDNEIRVRTLLGAAENLLSGTTTVQDMATIVGADRAHAASLRAAYREAGIRAVLALQYGDRAAVDTVPFWKHDLSDEVRAGLAPALDPAPTQALVEEMLDEGGSERLTWALGPSAPQRCSANLLRWTARLGEEREIQVFTHLYETRSQAVLARTDYGAERSSLVTFMDSVGLLSPRLTIAHGVWIRDDEIAALARAGAHLATNPISNLKLLNGVAPLRIYAENGVGIALGCDNCSGNDAQDMFASMKAFALWWGLAGEAGETGAASRAFDAATRGGAAALGLSGEVGEIRSGCQADLTLLRLDDPAFVPLNSAVRQLVYAATPRAISTVIVGGEVVVRDGKMVSFDRSALREQAEAMSTELCACVSQLRARFNRVMPEILRAHRRISCEPLGLDRFRLR